MVDIQLSELAVAVLWEKAVAELFASSRDSGCGFDPDALADFEKQPDICQSICAEHSDTNSR